MPHNKHVVPHHARRAQARLDLLERARGEESEAERALAREARAARERRGAADGPGSPSGGGGGDGRGGGGDEGGRRGRGGAGADFATTRFHAVLVNPFACLQTNIHRHARNTRKCAVLTYLREHANTRARTHTHTHTI